MSARLTRAGNADYDKRNAILAKNKIDFTDLRTYAKEDLARLLDVDAVISGKIQREKPMSEAAAVALGVLLGFWGPTNKVNVDLTIHDGASGELFWKYSHQLEGSVGSSSEQLVKAFTRKIGRLARRCGRAARDHLIPRRMRLIPVAFSRRSTDRI